MYGLKRARCHFCGSGAGLGDHYHNISSPIRATLDAVEHSLNSINLSELELWPLRSLVRFVSFLSFDASLFMESEALNRASGEAGDSKYLKLSQQKLKRIKRLKF